MTRTLLIDNYDSFTWNIYSDLSVLGGNPIVYRNDQITLPQIIQLYESNVIDRIVISPGPGHPATDSGVSREVIMWAIGKVPVLGVCMGLECLVDALGGEIAYAGEIKHGKTSLVEHDNLGIFHSLPPLLSSTRYHSLSASLLTLPPVLQVTATTQESGVIMAVRHRTATVEAVQYHPESCMSEGGRGLMQNFLKLKGGEWGGENEWCGVIHGGGDAEEHGAEGTQSSLGVVDANGVNGVVAEVVDGEQQQGSKSVPHRFSASASPVLNGSARFNGGSFSSVLSKNSRRPSVPSILDNIRLQRLQDVANASTILATTPENLHTSLALHTAPPVINLVDRINASIGKAAVMAEIKRASPSKGEIAPHASAPAQALRYALAGASVISVLTEPKWFKGTLGDMLAVRTVLESIPNRPAVLRKDFILAPYQIDEARLHGADTVLLIVAMLEPLLLKELYDYSVERGMEPLVEVNNPTELEIALNIGAKVIGVNNRNLHDFNVDMGTTSRVNAALNGRDNVILCALSGISSPADVDKYVAEGVKAVLVGEALMRATNAGEFLRNLISLPPTTTSVESSTLMTPLIKICGVRSIADASIATDAGADLVGIILVPGAKRCITYSQARIIAGHIRSVRAERASPTIASSASSSASPLPWFTSNVHRLASRRKPLLVGVFQNQSLDEIINAVDEIGLDIVQLHGDEPQEWARHIPVPVIKVFRVVNGEDGSPKILGGQVDRPGYNNYILLDAGVGGQGKSFDWSIARETVERGEVGTEGKWKLPIILAGGLNSENVKKALEEVKGVAVVDVSSGVEVDGVKSRERVEAFVKAVRG